MLGGGRWALLVVATLCALANASVATGQETATISYGLVDRATVRVFAIRGVHLVSIPSRGGFPRPLAVPDAGHGSGVAIAAEGVVLTAHHVVKDARLLAVQLPGSQAAMAARVIYEDPERDFALLSVAGTFEHVIPLPEQPATLRVRQTVHAVGYPVDPSRTTPQSARGIVSGELDDGMMQLDMDLNPGNSGGPLIDEQDQLVGIVVARGDPSRGIAGIGLAVPVSQIQPAWATVRGSFRGAPRNETDVATAALVAELVRLGAAGLIGEVLNVIDRSEDSQLLRRLSRVANPRAGADLLAIAAAYFWDWSQVILEAANATPSPPQLPAGRERDLSWRLMRAAIVRCQAAYAKDRSVATRSPFVSYIVRWFGTEAPPEDVPESINPSESGSPSPAPAGHAYPARGETPARSPEDALLRWYLGIGTTTFEERGLALMAALDMVVLGRDGASVHVSPTAGLHGAIGGRPTGDYGLFGFSLGVRLRVGEKGLLASAAWAPVAMASNGETSWSWVGAILRVGGVFGRVGLGAAWHVADIDGYGLVFELGPYVAWTYH